MIDGYFFWNGPPKKLNVWISQSEHESLDIYTGIYRDQYPNLTGWSPSSCECKNRDFSRSNAAFSTGTVFPFEDALMSVHDSMCALLRMLCQAGFEGLWSIQTSWWRILHGKAPLLSWKWLQNDGQRYSELPKAIPCNALQCLEIQLLHVCLSVNLVDLVPCIPSSLCMCRDVHSKPSTHGLH